MNDQNKTDFEIANISPSNNLDTLCGGSASSANAVDLEDLCWEHFLRSEHDGEMVSNRVNIPIVSQADTKLGGLANSTILELGAYEGYYSACFEKFGSREIIAIEANPRNFLKCCAVKNHLGLNRTTFLLGDCAEYLRTCQRRFDFVCATGILYHLFDPISALNHICRVTDRIIIDTTYYHPDPKLQGFKFTGATKPIDFPGLETHVLHERLNTVKAYGKKHGIDKVAWMFELNTLEQYLDLQGFRHETIFKKESYDPHRVRVNILAERQK